MRKFLLILTCAIIIIAFLNMPLIVNAEETTVVSSDAVLNPDPNSDDYTDTVGSLPDGIADEPQEGSNGGYDSEETQSHTIFTRIWQFVNTYRGECATAFSSLVLFIMTLAIKKAQLKAAKKAAQMHEGQNLVTGAVNEMIDGYNGLVAGYKSMKQSYDQYGLTEDERNRIVGANLAINTAILEILVTVYQNSKNLPQGVKDIVNIKYAKCLQTLDDDAKLKAIFEAVRINIGTISAPTSDTDDKKITEDSRIASEEVSEV